MQERNQRTWLIGVLNDNSWITKLRLECGSGFNNWDRADDVIQGQVHEGVSQESGLGRKSWTQSTEKVDYMEKLTNSQVNDVVKKFYTGLSSMGGGRPQSPHPPPPHGELSVPPWWLWSPHPPNFWHALRASYILPSFLPNQFKIPWKPE